MELISYLNQYFYTSQQLLQYSKISEQLLSELQQNNLVPQPSYVLNLKVECDSFFGEHQENSLLEYYAKGTPAWIGIVQSFRSSDQAYSLFSQRYKQTLSNLADKGHASADPKVNAEIDLHIEQEWRYFLNGIYGLCTRSGLPEDIAAKELAILEINALTTSDEPDANTLGRLKRAVDLLDVVSSEFAPHERIRSSRHRLVDEVRRQYRLQP